MAQFDVWNCLICVAQFDVWKCLPVPVFQVMTASTFKSSLPRESGWTLVKTSAKRKLLRLKPRSNRLELTPVNIKLRQVFFCTLSFFKTYGNIKYHSILVSSNTNGCSTFKSHLMI